jgi:hypothetical protein
VIWLGIRFVLMLCIAYFVGRLAARFFSVPVTVFRAVIAPNAAAFVLIFGTVSVIKFFTSGGASLGHIPATLITIALAQSVWLAFDWLRYKAERSTSRGRSRR